MVSHIGLCSVEQQQQQPIFERLKFVVVVVVGCSHDGSFVGNVFVYKF